MIPNNNFSVLPWYTSLDQQNARRWWLYDRVYPLFTPATFLLPFQLMREHRLKFTCGNQITADDYDNGYLTQTGEWSQNVGNDYGVSAYDVTGKQYVYFNVPPTYPMGVVAVAKNDSGDVLGIFNPNPGFTLRYAGGWQLPTGTTRLWVQTYNAQFSPNGNAYDATAVVAPVEQFKIYTRCGELVGDYPSVRDAIEIVTFDGYDYLVYTGLLPFAASFENGQYYAVLVSGEHTWYSEVFTVVNNITPYLKIVWWDNEDFVMDAGRIVYRNPNFKNVLYLDAQIAKPEYVFEEEGESRDGYFFPTKQISEKRYRFAFLASEYLLDVMRFIRMADFAYIESNGQRYSLDTFLITPEWESNGDVAAVSAEFDTATVAKKIGVGYVKALRGDFNDDFNNDFINQ